MPDRTPGARSGYFASFASARHMMLTTFSPDGKQESAVVHGVAGGDRAYFQAGNQSDTAENLRHTEEVQVAPCGALGFLLLAPPLDAVARPVSDEEARRVAGELTRGYLAWPRFPIPRLHRARRRQMSYYERSSYEAAATAVYDPPATDPRGNEPGGVRVTVVRNPGPLPWP
jgi:PPOX class probable F420-dependent enzyme